MKKQMAKNNRDIDFFEKKNLKYTHYTGQGPRLGMMGFYIMTCAVHTTWGQGQGTIVFYCAPPGHCPCPCPGACPQELPVLEEVMLGRVTSEVYNNFQWCWGSYIF